MALRLKPEHLQTVHYYFFFLGIFSLTSAFLFGEYTFYAYVFMVFYAAHSAISWYISWLLHVRMKDFFIINMWRYTASHVFLTVLSGGLAVLVWYLFGIQYEGIVTSFIMINFFLIFMGTMWYLMSVLKITERFFEWQDRKQLGEGRKIVLGFRNQARMGIVDDAVMNEYRWGTSGKVDGLFMAAKEKHGRGDTKGFLEAVRDIETNLCGMRISELEGKIQTLKKGEMSPTDANLVQAYQKLIRGYGKRMIEYEREMEERLKKA